MLSEILQYKPSKEMKFSEFVDNFMENPQDHLHTASSIILNSVKSKGFKIVTNNGVPSVSYNVFNDPFTNGSNAIFGQDKPIKDVLNIIESMDTEAGPNRGIVLVGPPASGKTNIIDILARSVEDFVKRGKLPMYTFAFKMEMEEHRPVYLRSSFNHNPLLLMPILLNNDGNNSNPRELLFNKMLESHPEVNIPMFYRDANLDKRTLDIIEALINSPRNKDKTLYEILEEYIVVYKLEYSSSQGIGISNIDKMNYLKTQMGNMIIDRKDMEVVSEHAPELDVAQYKGALVSSNRGMLHIHDAFGIHSESHLNEIYKPLLMLFGSGKINVESTQVNIDNVTFLTTNLEEMKNLEDFMSSLKIIDRIEKIPVNYLIDTNSEMDLLKRDAKSLGTKYDVDPNFFKIAAYYSVMTRLSQPKISRGDWESYKRTVFCQLTPPQKLFIYASRTNDIIKTLTNLPTSNKFVNETKQIGIDIYNPDTYKDLIFEHPNSIDLKDCGLFSERELEVIDEEFKEYLLEEGYPNEGKMGISTRQMQNIIRDVIMTSKNNMLSVPKFLDELHCIVEDGMNDGWAKRWIEDKNKEKEKSSKNKLVFGENNSDDDSYNDLIHLIFFVVDLYHDIIENEIVISVTDRDPSKIEKDLRKYVQHVLLDQARMSNSMSHIMVPLYSYVDEFTGDRVDKANKEFMSSIESIIVPKSFKTRLTTFRKNISNKFTSKCDEKLINIKGSKTKNIINSTNDGFIKQFSSEYNSLLSNKRTVSNVNVEDVKNAFYIKQNNLNDYKKQSKDIREFCDKVITNMVDKYGYSRKYSA